MADTVCLVPGCNQVCHPGGPRFVRLLCDRHREEIPAGVYVALAMQDCLIDALAEHTDVVREVLWEMEPERVVEHMSRAHNDRLFLDVNFGDRLLVRAKAETFQE